MTITKFLKLALKDHRVAAVMPSSKAAVKSILREVPKNTHYIIEYGPGDGSLTKELLKTLNPQGKLLAIEIVEPFVKELEKQADQRLTVIQGDILEELKKMSRQNQNGLAEVIVSGIPFSFFSKEKRKIIIENTHRLLKGGGVLVVYQASLLILPLLKVYFKNVKWRIEPRNIPPYFIMVAEK